MWATMTSFPPRATQSVLLGYTFGMKGYKLYDLQNYTISHSRDVIFQETNFPFHHTPVLQASDVDDPTFATLFPAPPCDLHYDTSIPTASALHKLQYCLLLPHQFPTLYPRIIVTNPPRTSSEISSSSSHSFNTHTNLIPSYPFLNSSDFTHFSSNYFLSLAAILQVPEPSTFSHAQQYPEWVQAMD